MASIRMLDFKLIDELFDMGGGYVFDFSDRTISRFFYEELNVDFDDPSYAREGTSKAKRLRCYLRTVETPAAVAALRALWTYRQTLQREKGGTESVANAEGRFLELVNRIQGMPGPPGTSAPLRAPAPAFNTRRLQELRGELLQLTQLEAQPRG